MRTLPWSVVMAMLVGACGGANLNRRSEGNRAGGIAVQEDEIAVDPGGERILVRAGADLFVGDLGTRTLTRIAGIAEPQRLAFWAGAEAAGFHALTRASDGSGRQELVSYDLGAGRVVWRRLLDPGPRSRLDVTADGRRVIVSGADVLLVDAASGAEAGRFDPGGPIEDVDVSPDGGRLIVTRRETWQDDRPQTAIQVVATADGGLLCTALVPNCADELVVHPEGDRAFLAPTSCRRDPVSIVDVTAGCRFEKNLPGFGPVALTADGRTGVAFLDRESRDPTAPARPPEVDGSGVRFHLMLFDTHTLELRTVPVGDQLPRYALTPDGRTLVVDGLADLQAPARTETRGRGRVRVEAQPVRMVDVADRTLRVVSGPPVMLDAFVLTPDSRQIWLLHARGYDLSRDQVRALDRGLYLLDLAAARIEPIPLPFAPLSLNTLPGAQTLLLRDDLGIHLFDVATRQVTASFEVRDGAPGGPLASAPRSPPP